jgi:predicted protein tyrosine phosphatase
MNINVVSKKEFVTILVVNNITDTTVDDCGQYFICIDSTGGPESAPYFQQTHSNVIRLVFDDVETDCSNWGPDIQAYYNAVAMREEQAHLLYKFIEAIPKNSTINIHCAKGQSRSVAVKSFILNEEDGNPHVLKLLRKVSGLFN